MADAKPKDRTLALLERLDGLPPLPPVARRLTELGDLEHADLGKIAAAVELDPALSARVLAMCRAASTGLGDRVRTVRGALSMLGVRFVRRVVIAAQICEMLRDEAASLDAGVGPGGAAHAFDREGYWVHCVAVACAGERIARWSAGRLGGERVAPDLAFVAGLLHGIGRLALELVAPKAVSRISLLAAERGLSPDEAEGRVLGITGADAGRRLALRWGLPEEIVAAVSDDPGPEGDESFGLVHAVRLSRWVCRRHHLGWSGDWTVAPATHPSAGMFGVGDGPGSVDALVADVIADLSRRLGELGVGWRGQDVSSEDVPLMMAAQANLLLDAMAGVSRTPAAAGRDAGVPDAA